MGAAWCVAWMAFSSNTPDECRMMKMEERLFLKKFTNGAFSSLPMMFNFIFKLSWGVLVDKLKFKKILTQTQGVKISQCFPTFGVACGLIPVALWATCQRPVLTLALFCFTNMCLGAHTR
ncbi:unnamed protein product [Heligmosomoides polygyrus]|uniref:ADP,ATP carrier protein n=1 Tax=Heligmosomoides polygyrus TaxID=6339 RepID=A0A183F531_HELPZ|nr:unnamed protein product [Heligmosomoides polygyrus]